MSSQLRKIFIITTSMLRMNAGHIRSKASTWFFRAMPTRPGISEAQMMTKKPLEWLATMGSWLMCSISPLPSHAMRKKADPMMRAR